MTAVTYLFYLPKARKGLAVTWANTDITIPADQLEAMRRAGVADMMQASIDATFAPQFNERPPPSHGFVPTPLFGVQVGMRDAYELARRAGLTRAHSIELKVGTKDPTVPLLIWTFRGDHTLVDSKAVNIDGGGRQQEHGIYFDGLRDYTVGPASDCAARGGTNAGPSSMGGSFCY